MIEWYRLGSAGAASANDNALCPAAWTSADAAGLPSLPGLMRYDGVVAEEASHALRFTAPETQRASCGPRAPSPPTSVTRTILP